LFRHGLLLDHQDREIAESGLAAGKKDSFDNIELKFLVALDYNGFVRRGIGNAGFSSKSHLKTFPMSMSFEDLNESIDASFFPRLQRRCG